MSYFVGNYTNTQEGLDDLNNRGKHLAFYDTENLTFDAVEENDLHSFARYRNRIWKYTREFMPLNMARQKQWYEAISRPDTKHIMFAIREKKSNFLIGCCGLTYIDWKNKSAEVSLYIDSAFRDKGYGKEVLSFLEFYGFDVLNLRSLIALVYDCNERSKRLFKTCNYNCVGVLKDYYFYKKYWDVLIFQKLCERIP